VNTQEIRKIPALHHVKVVVLFRDAYEVVQSFRKAVKAGKPHFVRLKDVSKWDYLQYWCDTYENILKSVRSIENAVMFVDYSHLTADPKRITRKLFTFIGSEHREGVDAYPEPEKFDFDGETDDGSENINSLKVFRNPEDSRKRDPELEQIVRNFRKIDEFESRYKKKAQV